MSSESGELNPNLASKPPDHVFDIEPGLEVKMAYITTEAISVDESVFTLGQLAIIEKMLTFENQRFENEMRKVEEEIAEIKEDCLEKIESEKKIAWQNGNQAGVKQAQNQMLSQVEEVTEQLRIFMESLSLQTDKFVEYREREILELIIKIARKVIDVEVTLSPEIILNTLKNSLNFLNEKEEIKIVVNPNYWTVVSENLKKLSLTINLPENIEVISNENIGAGGCRIDFKAGSIDADLETQFAEIKRKLLKHV